MAKFKVGDRVMQSKGYRAGRIGTVVAYHVGGNYDFVDVAFEGYVGLRALHVDFLEPVSPTVSPEAPLGGLTPATIDRMVRFVRECARLTADSETFIGTAVYDDGKRLATECRAIAALLPPEPVDPDAALARKLCDESTFDLDDAPVVTNGKIYELVKAAIRAGRETERYQSGRQP